MEYMRKIDLNSTTVNTFFEEGIDKEINLINSKGKIKNIDNIDFKNKEIPVQIKKEDIKSLLREKNNLVYIISGSCDYMKKVNLIINDSIKSKDENNEKTNCYDFIEFNKDTNDIKKNITIVNCYDFNEIGIDVGKIIEENDKILSTSELKQSI
jgi:hypothetical protein